MFVLQGSFGKVGPDANGVIGEDFCVYNSYQWFWSGRKAGAGFPLALGPTDPTRGSLGSRGSSNPRGRTGAWAMR